MGMFRVGSDQYAVGDDPTYGVTTLRPEHVRSRSGAWSSSSPPRAAWRRRAGSMTERSARCCVTSGVADGRQTGCSATGMGGAGGEVRSDEVNDYLREASGGEMTAKDFRTWHATVLAATGLPRSVRSVGHGPVGRWRR